MNNLFSDSPARLQENPHNHPLRDAQYSLDLNALRKPVQRIPDDSGKTTISLKGCGD